MKLVFVSLSLLSALGLFGQQPLGSGVNQAYIDRSIKPCDQFYDYANGGWLRTAVIPASESYAGTTTETNQRNAEVVRSILEGLLLKEDAKLAHEERLVKAFYTAGMDQKGINAAGTRPIQGILNRVRALRTNLEVVRELARLSRQGFPTPWVWGLTIDDKDSSKVLFQFGQSGLSLPARDYYLKQDEPSKAVIAQFKQHVARIFKLLGNDQKQAEDIAQRVLKIETAFAEAHLPPEALIDPVATYHKVDLKGLQGMAPGIDWKTFLSTLGVPENGDFLVPTPTFVRAATDLAAHGDLADWKAYLEWVVVNSLADSLPKDFQDEHFAFFSKALNGQSVPKERWREMSKRIGGSMYPDDENPTLAMAMGRLFVERVFPAESKVRVQRMVENIREAMRDRIKSLTWMTEPTKAKAIAKLDKLMVRIGYPDKWRNYAGLNLEGMSFVEMVLACRSFDNAQDLEKLTRPVDRKEWGWQAPAIRDAAANPSLNSITFPAGILRPPYFDPLADDAANYGAIGVVIGHEITHLFDSAGRHYDGDGMLIDWWDAADAKAYESQMDLLVKQYDAYEPLPGAHINGKVTLGENIADLGGVRISFLAWKRSLRGGPQVVIDGLTGPQRFFISYAQSRRTKYSDEFLRNFLKTDPHSPAAYRILGVVVNLPEFTEVFQCGDGTPMRKNPKGIPSIW